MSASALNDFSARASRAHRRHKTNFLLSRPSMDAQQNVGLGLVDEAKHGDFRRRHRRHEGVHEERGQVEVRWEIKKLTCYHYMPLLSLCSLIW